MDKERERRKKNQRKDNVKVVLYLDDENLENKKIFYLYLLIRKFKKRKKGKMKERDREGKTNFILYYYFIMIV